MHVLRLTGNRGFIKKLPATLNNKVIAPTIRKGINILLVLFLIRILYPERLVITLWPANK
jgi:hypothetical protein